MIELTTYEEYNEFCKQNERIGYYSNNYEINKYNMWICELFKNKTTGKYSILITADDDEEWDVIEFE